MRAATSDYCNRDPLLPRALQTALALRRTDIGMNRMNLTVIDLITPHLLRVVDLAGQAEKGVNVDWHVRDAVSKTMEELRDQWNAPALVTAYVDGLENAAMQASKTRTAYIRALRSAASVARAFRRD